MLDSFRLPLTVVGRILLALVAALGPAPKI